jgi:hypothetical protein
VSNNAADKRGKQDRETADERAKQDREDARERDFRSWQRDTLLRLGDEIVEAAIEAPDEILKICNSYDPS